MTTTLFCGDFRYLSAVDLGTHYPDFALFSPPYVGMRGYDGNVADWLSLMNSAASLLHMIGCPTAAVVTRHPRRGGYIPRGYYDLPEVFFRAGGYGLFEHYIWDKKNAPPSGNLSQVDPPGYEDVWLFSRTDKPRIQPWREPYADKTVGKAKTGNMRKPDVAGKMAGGHDRLHEEGAIQSNIIRVSSSGDQNRPRAKGGSFPRGLVRRLLHQYTNPGSVVIDPFAGVCTTAVVAEEMGRSAICVELDRHELEKGAAWLSAEKCNFFWRELPR